MFEEFFFMNFDFKNECENVYKENNEKSCSRSRNRVSHKIDFKAVWALSAYADSVGVNFEFVKTTSLNLKLDIIFNNDHV